MSRNYKFHNPIEECLIYKLKDYVYSSAGVYSGEKGILNNVIVAK